MVKQHLWKAIVAVALAATLVVPGVSATSTVFQSPPPGPPPNDNFYSATSITSLPFTASVDMTYATTQDYEPQSCNWSPQTVWYSYTPTVNEAVRVTLSGFYDSNLALYQAYGSDITQLSGMGCASWNSPSVTLDAVAGTTYYFQVGKIWGGGGTAVLNVELVLPPANDNFESATVVAGLPFYDSVDTIAATVQAGEPTPSCEYNSTVGHTVWYVFTPAESGSVSLTINPPFTPVFAVYSGSMLSGLNELGCRNYGGTLIIHLDAGTKYFFQVGGFYHEGGQLQFSLEATPLPYPNFAYYPYDPNVFDTVYFENYSWDPAYQGISSINWDFGDGTTATEPWSPYHRYIKDGDYTVKLTVNTPDGRTASTTRSVPVKTHDVAITKFTAPQSASTNQTRQIVVGLNSKRYVDLVEVQLFKSMPASQGEWQRVGTLQQTVPVRPSNRTTDFSFNYTFTKDDAAVGKVSFKAVATIVNARDALSADNTRISSPTKVGR